MNVNSVSKQAAPVQPGGLPEGDTPDQAGSAMVRGGAFKKKFFVREKGVAAHFRFQGLQRSLTGVLVKRSGGKGN